MIHIVQGTVAEGSKRATELGFPTINVVPTSHELPASGIYAGSFVYDGEEYPGAVCLAPNGKLEIHCFAQVPLKGRTDASLVFYEKIGEYVSGGGDEMKSKIAADIAAAKAYFSKRNALQDRN